MNCDLLSLIPLGACFLAPQVDVETNSNTALISEDMAFPIAEEHAMEAIQVRPFLAQFDVALNGDVIGFANMQVKPLIDAEFDVDFRTKITQGIGGFARARVNETTHLMMHKGNPRSISYSKEKNAYL